MNEMKQAAGESEAEASATQANGEFELKLSGEGITVERKIGREAARKILDVVLGGSGMAPSVVNRPTPSVRHASPGNAAGRQQMTSIREFLDECKARRNPDKIAAIGAYLIDYEGATTFQRGDVKSKFRSAGEAPPGNFSRDFSWVVSNGWIAEDVNESGQFYVTGTGRKAIEERFSGDIKKASSLKLPRRRKSRKGQASGGN